MGRHEISLIERREKLKADLETEAEDNGDEIETLKSMLETKTPKPRSGIVFRNVGRTIITENNLANNSKACCIQ
jgi:hypothetical protein